jgi:hypothetical protein
MDSGPTSNIHSVAPECNGQSRLQRSEPPAPAEGASLTTSENDKARTCLSETLTRPWMRARGNRARGVKTTGGENNEAGQLEWPPVRPAAGKPCRVLAINLID